MPLMTTKPMFDLAYDGGFAIGAFNVNNMELAQSIIYSASRDYMLRFSAPGKGVDELPNVAEEQMRLLRLMSCDMAQGYLFSRPVPAAEIDALLVAAAEVARVGGGEIVLQRRAAAHA